MEVALARTPLTLVGIRDYRRLTNVAIARMLNVSRQTIDNVMNGETKLNTVMAAKLGGVFGVPDHVLFMERDDALRWILSHTDGPDGGATEASEWREHGGSDSSRWNRHPRHLTVAKVAAEAA